MLGAPFVGAEDAFWDWIVTEKRCRMWGHATVDCVDRHFVATAGVMLMENGPPLMFALVLKVYVPKVLGAVAWL